MSNFICWVKCISCLRDYHDKGFKHFPAYFVLIGNGTVLVQNAFRNIKHDYHYLDTFFRRISTSESCSIISRHTFRFTVFFYRLDRSTRDRHHPVYNRMVSMRVFLKKKNHGLFVFLHIGEQIFCFIFTHTNALGTFILRVAIYGTRRAVREARSELTCVQSVIFFNFVFYRVYCCTRTTACA